MELKEAVARCIERHDLTGEEMAAVMRLIMTGGATPAQIAGLLVALRMKGETPTEIAAAAAVMRALATPVALDGLDHLVDIVGTGGDGAATFNVSTASTFVAAAAGCYVAKHGNRSVSSRSGAADVLESAGIKLDLTPEQVALCVREVGVGFMFAPVYHSAMRHAIGPRRELGVRTLFNLLGPLTNPASVPHQVLGVFSAHWLEPLALVLQQLGSRHVLVVHARDGLDELSIAERTDVAELRAGEVHRYSLAPEDFGLQRAPLAAIQVSGPAESLALIRKVLAGESGPARDMVLFNAGAAIYVAGRADSLAAGIAAAARAIDSGEAERRLERLIALTQSFA
ncbi:anthranilate phosphoribosyltransferase [Caldichromatium japonicum]|uniref:Anthranilate phosphoribosyltransferase n=1 Tax=Caldichromatium japonicum TaxID=2699430 RepID=A0A6G7VAY1_9GAMM|nr:anthranilate phosphoribosyltransferase [Caldichromatium japonicum]QIK37035.1 anthranilate phosphoribosyltransferase [Caldichromatium japonicum]